MSDIEVRELAAMVKAPVDVLMRQLKRAGIEVSGPEDKITATFTTLFQCNFTATAFSRTLTTVIHTLQQVGEVVLRGILGGLSILLVATSSE